MKTMTTSATTNVTSWKIAAELVCSPESTSRTLSAAGKPSTTKESTSTATPNHAVA